MIFVSLNFKTLMTWDVLSRRTIVFSEHDSTFETTLVTPEKNDTLEVNVISAGNNCFF